MKISQILAILGVHAPQLGPHFSTANTATFDDGGLITAADIDGPWEIIGVNSNISFGNINTEDELIKVLKTYVPVVALDWVASDHDPILPAEIGNFYHDFLYQVAWKLSSLTTTIERQTLAGQVLRFLNQDTNPPGLTDVAHKYFNAFKLDIV
jgi:hypothetical protein